MRAAVNRRAKQRHEWTTAPLGQHLHAAKPAAAKFCSTRRWSRAAFRTSDPGGHTADTPRSRGALALAASMTWEILCALILGFALSAVVQAVVRTSTIVRLLGDDRPRTLAIAAVLGAASSSCSYAAVALARSLISKGANFTAAMAFEIASSNLVRPSSR